MSLWQEKEENHNRTSRTTMSDVIFKINCQSLPVDHANTLATQLIQQVPWLTETDGAGIHPIHVAGTQNGWQRPDAESGEPLILSKRTRLRIRVPVTQTDTLINSLCGKRLIVDDMPLEITTGRAAGLQTSATLFSRYTIYSASPADEDAFLQHVIDDCKSVGFQPTKLLCGRSCYLSTPAGTLEAKSLLIADVPNEYSMALQEKGLGDYRLMGCGILIPHKDTDAVA